MELEEAIKLAPAIASEHPAPCVSERYQYVSTLSILNRLLEAGWIIKSARQNGNADPFATHSVTLYVGHLAGRNAYMGEARATAHLINSHDTSRRVHINAGLEVCVCDNQLHIPLLSTEVSYVHRRGTFDIDRAIDSITTAHGAIIPAVVQMRELQLMPSKRLDYANRALMHADGHTSPIFNTGDAGQLLYPLHEEQRDRFDLWTTYNIVQENLIERGRRGNGIHEILRNERLNLALWNEAVALLN